MASQRTRSKQRSQVTWPKRVLALFLVILIGVFALVMLTGDKSATPKLGIDLQGGTRVTLVPQGDKPTSEQLSQARSILEGRVNGMGVSGAEVVTDGDNLVITVPGEDAAEARNLGRTSQLLFRAVAQPQPPTEELPKVLEKMANDWVKAGVLTKDQANEKLAKVVPVFEQIGISNPPKELKVSAKEPEEPATSKEEQDFRDHQVSVLREARQSADPDIQNSAASLMECSGNDPLAGADDPSKPLVACSAQGPMVLEPAPLLVGKPGEEEGQRLTGSMIDTDSQITGGLDPQSAQMAITFRFKTGQNTPGGETWYQLGQQNLNKQVAITLDSQVISAPEIVTPTPAGEVSQITGDFSEQEAQDLANNLRYGALPLSFVGENGEPGGTTTTISPTMGEASLKAGILAGVVGLALIALWALFYYRGLGLIAMISLAASFLLVYGFLILLGRWIGYSLDLAGIAGLIIGLGTTADSFVIYFERIKDEIHHGGSFRSAVPRAWSRARSTIITGNFVSLLAAVILYFLAIGEVKGFAFTLGLTTVFDVVVAFMVTAPLVILLSRRKFFHSPHINGLGSAFRSADRRRLAAEQDPTAERNTEAEVDERLDNADLDEDDAEDPALVAARGRAVAEHDAETSSARTTDVNDETSADKNTTEEPGTAKPIRNHKEGEK